MWSQGKEKDERVRAYVQIDRQTDKQTERDGGRARDRTDWKQRRRSVGEAGGGFLLVLCRTAMETSYDDTEDERQEKQGTRKSHITSDILHIDASLWWASDHCETVNTVRVLFIISRIYRFRDCRFLIVRCVVLCNTSACQRSRNTQICYCRIVRLTCPNWEWSPHMSITSALILSKGGCVLPPIERVDQWKDKKLKNWWCLL